jgi:carbonic anhydrase/acetyltransferase-like protein (isoleucine patch superfamily)
MKSCHTFVENKLFNGKPSDVLPAGISTQVVDQPTKEQLEWLEKNKNKYLSLSDKINKNIEKL